MTKFPIQIEEYNPQWKLEFEKLEEILKENISNEISQIEHVGSTSIENLCAKPIIDIDIVIRNDESLMKIVISQLTKLEYIHVGDLGITGREAFKRLNSKTPNNHSNCKWYEHNLYLCKEKSIGLLNHIRFKNYLRNNSDAVKQYGILKKELAKKHPFNMDAYIDGKTNFIIEILKQTGMNGNSTRIIDRENRISK